MNHHFTTIEKAREYALAGHATLTISSLRTGARFTYKVKLATNKLKEK